jgi:predicted NAD/FAD-binding protein
MRIAVVGSGISGNLAARLLATENQVDLFEAGSHPGGHAHTVHVEAYGRQVDADVAFMVLNRRTYPHLCRMFELLGIDTQASDMSLSVRCKKTGLEYQGSSLSGLFAQRRNLIRASFLRMLRDIVRFNNRAIEFCEHPDEGMLLGEFVDGLRLGKRFRDQYLIPMSAAIWSADPAVLDQFPARFILGFFLNHGLLQLRDRPQWLTVAGRSQSYVTELIKPLGERVFLNCPVTGVRRTEAGVRLSFRDRGPAEYDHVVLACHADQSLAILEDASDVEKDVLSGFPYQPNSGVLHTDESLLPSKRRAWASWNYHIPDRPNGQVSVTYDLNRLQKLGLSGPLCLTLNADEEIDPSRVLQRFTFTHPVFSMKSVESQRRFGEINGVNGVSYCGAYWGYGFHEDGVNSALAVVRDFGLTLEDLQHSVRRQSPSLAPAGYAGREIAAQWNTN